MKKVVGVLCAVLLTCLMLVSCNQEQRKVKEIEDISEKVVDYLKSKDYKVVFYKGKVLSRTITEKDLTYMPYQTMWKLQKVNPQDYIGKKIETYEVIVKNHVLDNAKDNNRKQTIVSVLVVDGEIIGGTSKPDYDDGLVRAGGFISLEGKSLGEINN